MEAVQLNFMEHPKILSQVPGSPALAQGLITGMFVIKKRAIHV